MENVKSHDDEIDLFDLVESIWSGKWMVLLVTIISGLFGVMYVLFAPTQISGSLSIDKGRTEVFYQYIPINEQMKANGASLVFTPDNVFDEFVTEFRDYEELIQTVIQHSAKYKAFKGTPEEQEELAIKLAKQFQIVAPAKNETTWGIKFEWRDEHEARVILEEALSQVLANVRASSFSQVERFAGAVDARIERQLENEKQKLASIENQIDLELERRLVYLREQAAIARELGYETSRLSHSNNASSNSGVEVSVQATETPLYLRGYAAIDKEIALLKARSSEDRYSQSDEYIKTKRRVFELQSDMTTEQIARALDSVSTDDASQWVNYRLYLLDVASSKKALLVLIVSLVFGGMIGIFFVLIRAAYRNHQERKNC